MSRCEYVHLVKAAHLLSIGRISDAWVVARVIKVIPVPDIEVCHPLVSAATCAEVRENESGAHVEDDRLVDGVVCRGPRQTGE